MAVATEDMVAILPGLPDDVALRCLALLPRSQHAKLRCVSRRWCNLATKCLTSFHALRRHMGLTHDYLILFRPHICNDLSFSEVHLTSTILSLRKGSLRIPHGIEEEEWEFSFRGHACISMGPFVLILGGCSLFPEPSARLHIFNTSSGFWRFGASMQFERSYFAWGIINNLLYVAGGMGDAGCHVDELTGLMTAEVYDFDADRWFRVADMPLLLKIDLFFVYKSALYVRGCTRGSKERVLKLFSYIPSLDQWKDEDWMLNTVLSDVKPRTGNKLTTVSDNEGECLYMLDIQAAHKYPDRDTLLGDLKVLKLEQETSQWKLVYQEFDEAIEPGYCSCAESWIRRNVSFVSMGKKLVVMDHLGGDDYGDIESDDVVDYVGTEEGDVELREFNEVFKLSFECPTGWNIAVINA